MNIHNASGGDFELVRSIVSGTIQAVYSAFYPEDVVKFFLDHHDDEAIRRDIAEDNVFLLDVDGATVGTGTIHGNEITRVFVTPAHQRKGYGTQIMRELESIIARTSRVARLDSSLPGYNLYLKLGYRPVAYKMISTPGGQVLCYHEMEKTLRPEDASPEAYPFPHFDNHVFRQTAGPLDFVNGETSWIVRQEGQVLWGEYEGGPIQKGFMVGSVSESGEIELSCQHIDHAMRLFTGSCKAAAVIPENGRIRIECRREWRVDGQTVVEDAVLEEVR
jgi:GNAT superfamily N-acetyltransferase